MFSRRETSVTPYRIHPGTRPRPRGKPGDLRGRVSPEREVTGWCGAERAYLTSVAYGRPGSTSCGRSPCAAQAVALPSLRLT